MKTWKIATIALVTAVLVVGPALAKPNRNLLRPSKGFSMHPPKATQLFGHVTLVQGYDVPKYHGCHALIKLRDSNQTIAVMTRSHRLQTVLETGLATGNLVGLWGHRPAKPISPMGGTWGVKVYYIRSVLLYKTK